MSNFALLSKWFSFQDIVLMSGARRFISMYYKECRKSGVDPPAFTLVILARLLLRSLSSPFPEMFATIIAFIALFRDCVQQASPFITRSEFGFFKFDRKLHFFWRTVM